MTSPITLFLCGDVMTGRGIDQILPHPSKPRIHEPYLKDARGYLVLAQQAHGPIAAPAPFSYIWGEALQVWDRMSPDLRIVNLETSITTCKDYWKGKGINYRMHPKNVECLKRAGIDACALANNHVLDWGYAGLEETIAVLDGAGVKHAGAGRNLAQAKVPATLAVPGKGDIRLFSYGAQTSGVPADWGADYRTPGVNLIEISPKGAREVAQDIAAAGKRAALTVASLHWGANWGFEVGEDEVAFAHDLIDRGGVDIVYGHSSHHVKAMEVYRGRLILYGCGDFINDYEGIRCYAAFRGDLGLMYFASCRRTGELEGMTMVPVQTCNFRLRSPSDPDRLWLRDTLNREGRRFGTSVTIAGDGSLTLNWS